MECWHHLITAMDTQNSPFKRRLRLLLAQEFAARGYFLDAESFYGRVPLNSLQSDELELLCRVAMASGEEALAHLRLEALKVKNPESEILRTGFFSKDQSKGIKCCKWRWWQWLRRASKREVASEPSSPSLP
jgi:hypothetical protein